MCPQFSPDVDLQCKAVAEVAMACTIYCLANALSLIFNNLTRNRSFGHTRIRYLVAAIPRPDTRENGKCFSHKRPSQCPTACLAVVAIEAYFPPILLKIEFHNSVGKTFPNITPVTEFRGTKVILTTAHRSGPGTRADPRASMTARPASG